MSHKCAPPTVSTIGIDLGKNSFHLVSLDQRGAIVWQLKCSRAQLERRLANIPSCLIGMEACSGSHYIARQLAALGHDVRLIPAQYVKPFLKGEKNDYRDAGAIAEAVQRPTMHFVAIKTPEQMDLLALHRVHTAHPCLGHAQAKKSCRVPTLPSIGSVTSTSALRVSFSGRPERCTMVGPLFIARAPATAVHVRSSPSALLI